MPLQLKENFARRFFNAIRIYRATFRWKQSDRNICLRQGASKRLKQVEIKISWRDYETSVQMQVTALYSTEIRQFTIFTSTVVSIMRELRITIQRD